MQQFIQFVFSLKSKQGTVKFDMKMKGELIISQIWVQSLLSNETDKFKSCLGDIGWKIREKLISAWFELSSVNVILTFPTMPWLSNSLLVRVLVSVVKIYRKNYDKVSYILLTVRSFFHHAVAVSFCRIFTILLLRRSEMWSVINY